MTAERPSAASHLRRTAEVFGVALGLVLPFWKRLRRSASVRRALAGTNAAVGGILGAALVRPVGTSALGGPLHLAIAAAGSALLRSGRVSPIVVVGLCAVLAEAIAA